MITVTILINGQPIYTRSAVNISEGIKTEADKNAYKVDDGTILRHIPEDGAIALVKKMLDTIKEVK